MADLTIIMPSWNKEKYIAEALDSVFAQETDFSYEVVVADDHSTDRTLEIVAEYEKRHPGIIRVLRSDENLKLFKNVRRAYEICKTPFFCILDPDDYWTDPRHLDKALTFLSGHPSYTIYSAGIEMLTRDGKRTRCELPEVPCDCNFDDYLRQDAAIAYTQTCVYRNVIFANGLPEKIANPPFPSMTKSFRGDSFRNFIHIQRGKAHFSPDVEACYRATDEGVFQGLDKAERMLLNAQLLIDFWRYDDGRYPKLLAQSKRTFDRVLPVLLSATKEPMAERYAESASALAKFYNRNRWLVERGFAELSLEGNSLRQRLMEKSRNFLHRIVGRRKGNYG